MIYHGGCICLEGVQTCQSISIKQKQTLLCTVYRFHVAVSVELPRCAYMPCHSQFIIIVSCCTLYCLGSTAEVVSLEFDGCTELPCHVYHGTHATGRITLKANTATNNLQCKVN